MNERKKREEEISKSMASVTIVINGQKKEITLQAGCLYYIHGKSKQVFLRSLSDLNCSSKERIVFLSSKMEEIKKSDSSPSFDFSPFFSNEKDVVLLDFSKLEIKNNWPAIIDAAKSGKSSVIVYNAFSPPCDTISLNIFGKNNRAHPIFRLFLIFLFSLLFCCCSFAEGFLSQSASQVRMNEIESQSLKTSSKTIIEETTLPDSEKTFTNLDYYPRALCTNYSSSIPSFLFFENSQERPTALLNGSLSSSFLGFEKETKKPMMYFGWSTLSESSNEQEMSENDIYLSKSLAEKIAAQTETSELKDLIGRQISFCPVLDGKTTSKSSKTIKNIIVGGDSYSLFNDFFGDFSVIYTARIGFFQNGKILTLFGASMDTHSANDLLDFSFNKVVDAGFSIRFFKIENKTSITVPIKETFDNFSTLQKNNSSFRVLFLVILCLSFFGDLVMLLLPIKDNFYSLSITLFSYVFTFVFSAFFVFKYSENTNFSFLTLGGFSLATVLILFLCCLSLFQKNKALNV